MKKKNIINQKLKRFSTRLRPCSPESSNEMSSTYEIFSKEDLMNRKDMLKDKSVLKNPIKTIIQLHKNSILSNYNRDSLISENNYSKEIYETVSFVNNLNTKNLNTFNENLLEQDCFNTRELDCNLLSNFMDEIDERHTFEDADHIYLEIKPKKRKIVIIDLNL